MKKLKLFNGRAWHDTPNGRLFVCASSVREVVDLVNQVYRKLKGYENRPDITACSLRDINVYWVKGHWGKLMDGITPEKGVWFISNFYQTGIKPQRLL